MEPLLFNKRKEETESYIELQKTKKQLQDQKGYHEIELKKLNELINSMK